MASLAPSCGPHGEAVGTGGHLHEDGELHRQQWTGHLTWPGNAEEEEEEEEKKKEEKEKEKEKEEGKENEEEEEEQ